MKISSQTYARVFSVIGTVLLIPGLLGLLFSLLIIWLFLIILPLSVVGIFLLIGYFKRVNNRLDGKRNISLWISTIIYNGFLFLLTFGFIFYRLLNENLTYDPDFQVIGVLIFSGYFILTALGIFALNAARAEYMEEKANRAARV